ncbi:uncharacterized protein LOC114880544 isoform X4 [Osmia bicornis bicornis]|uniref:uncharacterized protein LOC114880544 isoform X4 n=1 Tax=Osmia bicornis bicornis TaxID=1437191 RepID=UPI001EAF86E4|nr:uncharacterized protein LOC114880544 isoform X4 [Osmia bicornis bicornis]
MFEMQDNEEFKLVIHRKKRTSFARKCCDSTVTLPVVVVDNDDDDDDDDEDNEIPLRNNFIYKDVFSDLNIHIFLEENINAIPQSFWNKRDEPCYRGAEIHYLTAKQTEQIDAKNCCTEDET